VFTGIVQDTGQVSAATPLDQGLQLTVRTRLAREGLEVGESICVSGACLTVEEVSGDAFRCFLSAETLRCTTLGTAHEGTMVNLERALRLSDRLGGHLVTGHIDAVGAVTAWQQAGEAVEAEFSAPPDVRRCLAPKGSVAVDGVSLTVAEVTPGGFRAALIRHTLVATTLGVRTIGDAVNLETDIVAKYVAVWLSGGEVRHGLER